VLVDRSGLGFLGGSSQADTLLNKSIQLTLKSINLNLKTLLGRGIIETLEGVSIPQNGP
jgi:hypothetical protein